MGRYWDEHDVYQASDEDRAKWEATHSSGFHIEPSGDENGNFFEDDME